MTTQAEAEEGFVIRRINTEKGSYFVKSEGGRYILEFEGRKYKVLGGVNLSNIEVVRIGGKSEGNMAFYYAKRGEPEEPISLLDILRNKIRIGDSLVVRCIGEDGSKIGNNGVIILPGKIEK